LRPRKRLVAVGETDLNVREWEADGPPILFWDASRQLAEAGSILARWFGYRVIGIEVPGPSDEPRELLDALGLERPVWSGSSSGAIVGLHLGAAHPERLSALVLLDGGYIDSTETDTLERLGLSDLPVLLLAAAEAPREHFAELVPQADIRVVPGASLESRPGEVARTLGGWLQALPYA
jgi:pimeloyl-ACP methyl ester carboxylesterase